MDLRDILLIGHIMGVVVMGFGSGAGLLAMVSAGSSPDLQTVARSARLGLLGGRVTTYAAIVVMLLGTWLVIETSYKFSEAWISASYLAWIVAMGVAGGVMMRHERRLIANANAAIARGETTNAEVLADWNAPIVKIGGVFLTLLYVVFTYLMVVKPGA